MFQKATRKQNKLRMALDGPSGAGKTYTALVFGTAVAKREGTRVAFIDTEHKSASLYVGENGWEFDVVELESFAPSTYTACMEAAAREKYGVLIIDSLSHAWTGTGGALDQVDRGAGKPGGGGKFGAWRDVTPQHNTMIEAIRRYPGHVILTLRTKMEYSLEVDEKTGKKHVEKIGMRPIQREGVEYEFDVVADMDQAHRLTISKTRFSGLDGKIVHKPGPEFILPVLDWLQKGTNMKVSKEKDQTAGPELAKQIKEHWRTLGWSGDKLKAFLTLHDCERVEDLPRRTGVKLLKRVDELAAVKQAEDAF